MRIFDDLNVVRREGRIDLTAGDQGREVVRSEAVDLRRAVRILHERIIETDIDLPLGIAGQ